MKRRRSRAGWAAVSLAALLLTPLAGSGCGEYKMLVSNPPARQTAGAPELFATGAERPGRIIAVVQSSARAGLEDAVLAKHVRELRRAASRAGADAVINIRMLTVKKEGYIYDEAPPFPAAKQGAYARYIMRGEAVVYLPEGASPEEATNIYLYTSGADGRDALDGESEPELFPDRGLDRFGRDRDDDDDDDRIDIPDPGDTPSASPFIP
jgi:hypothetical protein